MGPLSPVKIFTLKMGTPCIIRKSIECGIKCKKFHNEIFYHQMAETKKIVGLNLFF